jgi:hypothetical protein
MAQKATHRQTSSSSAVPVVLFGVDGNGKPKAARFPEKQADLATKAAGHLNLRVLQIVGPDAIDLAARLSEGRIHANGRGFVPYIRRDLYAKIVAAAGGTAPGDQALAQVAAAGGSTESSSPSSGELPPDWDGIAAGHVVIAQDEPTEGWYEAVVVETSGDMLTLRWRDYPRERRFSRHKFSVALMYPHDLPAVDPKTVSMPSQPAKAKSAPKGAAEPKAVYPKTWDEIDVDCLVLCKEDGPWRSWWEAIPIAKSDHMFLLRWRDFPQVPNVTRFRWMLGLLYPNGR